MKRPLDQVERDYLIAIDTAAAYGDADTAMDLTNGLREYRSTYQSQPEQA